MKRIIIALVSIIIGFVIQTTVFKWISFGGIIPNILIILTATYGFMAGEKAGIGVGFLSGLLADIFFGSFIGLNALIYMYVGYLNGKFNRLFYEEDVKLPMILILSSDLFYNFCYYVIMFLLRGRFSIGFYFTKIMLPEAIYTILITLVVHPLRLFIHNRLSGKKSRGSEFTFV
jgi:rod shape-determining protein MreD